MKKSVSENKLAKTLAKDLTLEGLVNFLKENERMIKNEEKFNRSTEIYNMRIRAAIIALRIKSEVI